MICSAHILPNIPHELRLNHDGAFLRLLDETGENTLLFIGLKDGAFVFNDQLKGSWGVETTLMPPGLGEVDRDTVWIKFNGTYLEAWTRSFATKFERFDTIRAQSVRFMSMQGAVNVRDTLELLVLSPEAMTSAIKIQMLSGRMSQLEKMIGMQSTAGATE